MSFQKPVQKKHSRKINEDWLSLIIAFTLIFLATLGILGGNGFPVSF